jgi:hypothetical protein
MSSDNKETLLRLKIARLQVELTEAQFELEMDKYLTH